jgi:predicted esterase
MACVRMHWLVLGLMGMAVACGSDAGEPPGGQGADVSGNRCLSGAESACACTDGRSGVQVCLDDGAFAPCECEVPASAPGCAPGSMAACTCFDGASGTQTCRSDGLYDACACAPAAPATGGAPAGTGGIVGTGGTTGGEQTGGVAGEWTEPTGGTAGDVSGGTGGSPTEPTGGSTSTGGSSTAGVNDPIIPSPDGTCPTFTSGSQVIKGLNTNMAVGTPGATKGALLFTWHGTGSSGNVALNYQTPSSVRNDITGQGGIVIAPNDNGQTRTGTSANGVWYETSDLEYADHIVACAVQNHNIDPRRIYVTGCSAGGLMAGAMALKRSNYVAAAYPDSGGLTSTLGRSLQDPSRVPAVFTMHGGSGDNVVINFGTTSANLCNFIEPKGGFAVDCNHSSGHCGAPTALKEKGWEFMKAHPFGTAPSPYTGGLPAGYPTYCKIWPVVE